MKYPHILFLVTAVSLPTNEKDIIITYNGLGLFDASPRTAALGRERRREEHTDHIYYHLRPTFRFLDNHS